MNIGIIEQKVVSVPTSTPSGLISYYRFDGDSTDEVGSNDGTDTNVGYSTGISGSALDLTVGGDSYVDLNTTQLIGGSRGAFTICVWLKDAITCQIFGSWQSPNQQIIFQVLGNTLKIFLKLGGTQYGGTVVAETWTGWRHVAMTYNGSVIKCFIDSVEQTTTFAASGTSYASPTQNEFWGRWANTFGSAELDCGGIWHRALSQGEIDDVYAIGLAGNELV